MYSSMSLSEFLVPMCAEAYTSLWMSCSLWLVDAWRPKGQGGGGGVTRSIDWSVGGGQEEQEDETRRAVGRVHARARSPSKQHSK